MSRAYRPQSLVANDGTIISLRYVESISQVSQEDTVVDKLKGDLTFTVTTVSGNTHTISIEQLTKVYTKDCHFDDNKHETYLAILDRWINLLG